MITNKDLSIIIPYNPENIYAEKVFQWCRNRLEKFLPLAEIVVEVYHDLNKSKAINLGVKKASREILLIIEPNIVFNLESMLDALKVIDFYDCIIPCKYAVQLFKDTTDNLLSFDCNVNMCDTKVFNLDREDFIMSTYLLIKKDKFLQIGGYNEKIHEWGGEKVDFEKRCFQSFSKILRFENDTIWRLYEDKTIMVDYQGINLHLINEYE